MKEWKLGIVEARFADLIWENEPIRTQDLVKLCEERLHWKRTTTYTVLKRLSERGLFCNDSGTVRVMVSREEFYAKQSERFIDDTFAGSLPAFLTAFTSRKRLTPDEVEEIRRMIDSYEE